MHIGPMISYFSRNFQEKAVVFRWNKVCYVTDDLRADWQVYFSSPLITIKVATEAVKINATMKYRNARVIFPIEENGVGGQPRCG